MADGTQRAIETIRPGDWVLAFDEHTGAVRSAPVTHLYVHRNWQNEARTVLVNGRLRATDNHPFFANGGWERADTLTPGALVRTLTPGPADHGGARTTISERVGSLLEMPGVDTVYNLEVATYHTYFAEGMAVHNMKVHGF